MSSHYSSSTECTGTVLSYSTCRGAMDLYFGEILHLYGTVPVLVLYDTSTSIITDYCNTVFRTIILPQYKYLVL